MFRCITAILLVASTAYAQDQNNPEEMKKLYQEAVTQLKGAQDRKNELAAENEKLTARIAELEKQLAEKNIEAAGFAERTWYLRSHYASWQRFIERYPLMKERWKAFLSAKVMEIPTDLPEMGDERTG